MATSKDIGGYEFDFVGSPPDMLLCRICLHPTRDPYLIVCCGYNICKSCLEKKNATSTLNNTCILCRSGEFPTTPNKQIDRLVKSLQVFCTNKDKGCEWQGEVNDVGNHLESSDGCRFVEVNCPNYCRISMQRQNLTKHVETECVRRRVDCQYCHITEEYQIIDGEHKEQCPKLPLPCPNKCDVDNIPREEISTHMMRCPFEEVECINENCGKTLLRQNLAKHVEMECLRRKIVCQFCSIRDEFQFIEGEHKKLCPGILLPCPNKCDIGTIKRGDMEEHLKICPLESIHCEYHEVGCTDVITRANQVKHNKEEMEKHLSYTKSELTSRNQQIAALENTLQAVQRRVNELETRQLPAAWQNINALEQQLQNTLQYGQHLNISSLKSTAVCPVTIKLPNFANTKKTDQIWFTTFFIDEGVYKLKFCVNLAGHDSGRGTHLSLCLYLMKGPNDGRLQWPLRRKITIKLLNQIKDNHHHYLSSIFAVDRVGFSRSSALICKYDQFISNERLYDVANCSRCLFLKDDSIFFHVRTEHT
ncbi:TNF receptor-associated factor 4-like [Dysidea avara]|uniref:TNF receptor-associated factor 4-like n=1 Tax=Dysidea avara TaxID=196820 RepID=UPI003334A5CF